MDLFPERQWLADEPTPGRYQVRGWLTANSHKVTATWSTYEEAERNAEDLLDAGYNDQTGKRYLKATVHDLVNEIERYSVTRPRKSRGK